MQKRSFLSNNRYYEKIFITVTLMSFLYWIIIIFIQGSASSQWNIFFKSMDDFLADRLNVIGYSGESDVYNCTYYSGIGEKCYPALTYIFTYLISRVVNLTPYYKKNNFLSLYENKQLLMLIFIIISVTIVVLYESIREYKEGRKIIKLLFALAIILSRPVIFAIERGNTIIISAILVIFYLFNYDNENKKIRYASFMALAVAAALKVTPALLGILLIYEKRWKDARRLIIMGIIMVFLPFIFIKGGFVNILYWIRNVSVHLMIYGDDRGCTLYAGLLFYLPENKVMHMVAYMITQLVCILFAASGFVIKDKRIIISNILLILIIFPTHSEGYCILYIIPAMIMFFNDKEKIPLDIMALYAYISIMMTCTLFKDYIFNYHLGLYCLIIYNLIRTFQIINKEKQENIQKQQLEIVECG